MCSICVCDHIVQTFIVMYLFCDVRCDNWSILWRTSEADCCYTKSQTALECIDFVNKTAVVCLLLHVMSLLSWEFHWWCCCCLGTQLQLKKEKQDAFFALWAVQWWTILLSPLSLKLFLCLDLSFLTAPSQLAFLSLKYFEIVMLSYISL